ncbi:MAG: permease [Candidatus Aminicenantes bacterium]|nr:permease [Candidatus Aminicenantes bacterium]
MDKKRRTSNMLIPTLVMAVLAIVLLYIGYSKGQGQHIIGLKSAFKITIQILPLLIFAFIMAGMIQTLLPRELISKWIGEESGLRGILIGSLVGAITPGGPYVTLPVAAGFLRAGAGVGTMVAFVTAWSLWAVTRLPMEIGILGWKFTAARLVCTFFFPPIAGFIAQLFFSGFK